MKLLLEQIHFTQLELKDRGSLKIFNMGQARRNAEAKNRKLNSLQLRSRSFKDKKQLLVVYSGKSVRQLKNIAPEEFLLIKEEIRRKARKESRRSLLTWIITGIALILLLLFLF